MSTRPTYFESFDEMLRALRKALGKPPRLERLSASGIDIDRLMGKLHIGEPGSLTKSQFSNALRIQQLDPQQIAETLQKRAAEIRSAVDMTVGEFQSFLYSIYDLEDLMRRPLLLKMIIETVLAAEVDIRSAEAKLGPSTLYDLYTQMCAIRDVKKASVQQYLTELERLSACRSIALAMFDKGRIELRPAEVMEAISAAGLSAITTSTSAKRPEALARALTDVRLCSFLRFEDDGSLSFAHKSYQEFFIAQTIFMGVKEDPSSFDRFAQWRLSRETLYFLGSFARDQEDFGAMLRLALREPSLNPERRNFLYAIAFASGVILERSRLAGGEVRNVELRRAFVRSTSLSDLTLHSTRVRDVTAEEWTLNNVVLKSSSLSKTTFSQSELSVESIDSELEQLTFIGGTFRIHGDDWKMQAVKGTTVRFEWRGGGRLLDVETDRKSIVVIGEKTQIREGSSLKLTDSIVVGHSLDRWYEYNVGIELRNCVLAGVWMDASDLLAGAHSNTIRLEGCRGAVILYSSRAEKLNTDALPFLRKAHPDILFTDADALKGDYIAQQVKSERPKRVSADLIYFAESVHKSCCGHLFQGGPISDLLRAADLGPIKVLTVTNP